MEPEKFKLRPMTPARTDKTYYHSWQLAQQFSQIDAQTTDDAQRDYIIGAALPAALQDYKVSGIVKSKYALPKNPDPQLIETVQDKRNNLRMEDEIVEYYNALRAINMYLSEDISPEFITKQLRKSVAEFVQGARSDPDQYQSKFLQELFIKEGFQDKKNHSQVLREGGNYLFNAVSGQGALSGNKVILRYDQGVLWGFYGRE